MWKMLISSGCRRKKSICKEKVKLELDAEDDSGVEGLSVVTVATPTAQL